MKDISISNAAQVKLAHENEFWKHAQHGNGAALLSTLRADPQCLTERGPLGETILHMLTLYGHEELARTMASRWPSLIPKQYLGEEYQRVSEEAEQQWRLERARIIHSIQSEFLVTSNSSGDFWIEMNGERFLQVEKLDKEWNKKS